MTDVSTAVRRLQIETTVKGAGEAATQLGQLNTSYQDNAKAAVSAEKAGVQYESRLVAMQRQCEAMARAQLAQNAAYAAQAAAVSNSSNAMIAANDNAGKSFTMAGIEAATLANHLRVVAEASYAFSPAFRGVVNGLAAPALRGASVALVAVATGIVAATNLAGAGLVRVGASAALASSSLTPIAGVITSAGLAMQAFNPSIAAVAASILTRFAPALRLLGAVGLVINAAKMVGDAWELGGEQLERYRQIAERAAQVDLSTTYFQKLVKGAEDSKISVEGLTTALTTLQKQSADQLGGSALQNRLSASVKAGNFAGNTGVQDFAQANTTQQRFEAIVSLINQAMTAGQRLAAIDIAGTAFGPEVADNLRKDSEYLDKVKAAAEKVADTQIVSPEDVSRALDLKNRYDAAVAILETRWHPVQDLLTAAGVNMHAAWIGIVETIAGAVDWATKLVTMLGAVPAWFQKKINEGSQWVIDNTTTPESRKAAEVQYGATSDPAEMAKGTDAYSAAVNKLRVGLQNQAAVQQQVAEANTIAQKTLGDTSKEIDGQKKAVDEAANAYDRAVESVTKHTARQMADAQAVGLGAGALEEYRASTQLMMAAQLAGIPITEKIRDQIQDMAQDAGEAGAALARLKLEDRVNFDRATIGLSQSDLAAAQAMQNLYGNKWQSHMDDALAKQIRMNSLVRQVGDLTGSAFSSIAKDVAHGVEPMQAIAKAAKSAAESVVDIAAKQVVGNLLGDMLGNTAAQATGATSAATILTGAGASVAAAMVAGATEAAGILAISVPTAAATLPVAGAVTGGEVAAGGVTAGAALAVGGTAAGAAMWGPLALLAAAVAAIGALSFFGGGDEEKKREAARVTALNNRATLANLDQTTLQGQLTAFDLNANVERTALPNGGKTERSWTNALTFGIFGDSGGEQSEESIALERALAAERIKVIEDFNAKAIETEKQRVEAATKMMNDAVAMLQNFTLSDTAERLKDIQSASSDLTSALTQLGQSTEGVAAQVRAAMDDLRKTFTDGLTARLNSAIGRGYINDITELFRQRAQDLKDAASIGTSDYQVGIVFRAEAQRIVNDAGLVGDAFTQFIKLFPDLAGVVTESSTAVEAAVKQQQDALNSSAKSIVDYVNGLTAGSQSTLSPQARMDAAQAQYNTKLALAQGGNVDAQNSITDAAEDFRTAARDLLGSTTGYQNIEAAIRAQLLALPAVQQTTDPVVAAMRDVLLAINAGNASQATDATLNQVKSASQSTSASTAAAASLAQQQNDILAYANSLSGTANSISVYANDIGNNQVALLNSINGLQNTASSQLALLNNQYAERPFQVAAGGGIQTINNTMISALNKIVFNTWATAANTSGGNHFLGVLATGGWITGGRPGKDSVPLNGGRTLGMPGEYVVTRDVAQANKDWLPDFNAGRGIPIPRISMPAGLANDNSSQAVLAELRELRKELAEIRGNTRNTVAAVAGAAQLLSGKIEEGTDLQKDNNKMLRRR